MSHKYFVKYFLIALLFFGPMSQFFLFRYTALYQLNLLSYLYDNAQWVKDKPRILIMGSSHARYHIIPSLIANMNDEYSVQDIVNIGENSASPFEMYVAYNKQIQKFSNLKIVYYTLDPHMLGEKYYLYNDYEKIFLSYKQWRTLNKIDNVQNEFFFPFQMFVNSLKFKIENRSLTNGFTPLDHHKFENYKDKEVANDIYGSIDMFPVSKYQIKYLAKLKDEIEQKGAKFIFVLTPSYDWANNYKNECAEYDNMLVSYLNKYVGKAIVTGSLYGKDFLLHYEDYKDNTHLAYSGAVKFTKALFNNISSHLNLAPSKIKNLYLYRYKNDNIRSFK